MVKELQKTITQDIEIVTHYSQIVESPRERGSEKRSRREVTYHVRWIFNQVKSKLHIRGQGQKVLRCLI